ncbi:hypothetical protein JCM24511_09531 [Saitozyma sp. JCM 24511]|nr:hypothetical protein JCM24511_09531 [Saitozyma sp. JCM 24511]
MATAMGMQPRRFTLGTCSKSMELGGLGGSASRGQDLFSFDENTLISRAPKGRIQQLGPLNCQPQAGDKQSNMFQPPVQHFPLNGDVDCNKAWMRKPAKLAHPPNLITTPRRRVYSM